MVRGSPPGSLGSLLGLDRFHSLLDRLLLGSLGCRIRSAVHGIGVGCSLRSSLDCAGALGLRLETPGRAGLRRLLRLSVFGSPLGSLSSRQGLAGINSLGNGTRVGRGARHGFLFGPVVGRSPRSRLFRLLGPHSLDSLLHGFGFDCLGLVLWGGVRGGPGATLLRLALGPVVLLSPLGGLLRLHGLACRNRLLDGGLLGHLGGFLRSRVRRVAVGSHFSSLASRLGGLEVELGLGFLAEGRELETLDGGLLSPVVGSSPLSSLGRVLGLLGIHELLDTRLLGRLGGLIRGHVLHGGRKFGNLLCSGVELRLHFSPDGREISILHGFLLSSLVFSSALGSLGGLGGLDRLHGLPDCLFLGCLGSFIRSTHHRS
mmetsp:Transcript_54326/g.96572  ORF Transcript_54326/g.96572 Transcript_54326/m.96572 type:complete len:373 (-) Transcript_54326:893-2011(-)